MCKQVLNVFPTQLCSAEVVVWKIHLGYYLKKIQSSKQQEHCLVWSLSQDVIILQFVQMEHFIKHPLARKFVL